MPIWTNRYIRWLVFAIATLAVLWLWQQQFDKALPAPQDTAQGIDYSLSNVNLRQYSEDGSRHYVINARSIEHQPVEAVYLIRRLKLDWQPDTDNHWQLDATSGRMNDARDDLLLQDGIIAQHDSATGPVKIRTQRLRVQPNAQLASTQDKVDIDSPMGTATADGAIIDIAASIVQLQGNVQAQYSAGGNFSDSVGP